MRRFRNLAVALLIALPSLVPSHAYSMSKHEMVVTGYATGQTSMSIQKVTARFGGTECVEVVNFTPWSFKATHVSITFAHFSSDFRILGKENLDSPVSLKRGESTSLCRSLPGDVTIGHIRRPASLTILYHGEKSLLTAWVTEASYQLRPGGSPDAAVWRLSEEPKLQFLFPLFVPTLSQQNVDRLVARQLAENPPVLRIQFGEAGQDYVQSPAENLVKARILQHIPSFPTCYKPSTGYELTDYGRQIATAKGWRTAAGNASALVISLGRLKYVNGSAVVSEAVDSPNHVRITFRYVFQANSNVQYLLGLAPASSWDWDLKPKLGESGKIGSSAILLAHGRNGWSVYGDTYKVEAWRVSLCQS